MLRPFPAGLLTDAGLLVANPVFADATRQRQLGRTAYHGTVTWSWQQALLVAGLERQIARRDLPAATTKRLLAAHQRLLSVIEKTRELRASELWSWRYVDGRYEPVPFGQSSGDADESNAAQLWSTVYLAIPATARTSEALAFGGNRNVKRAPQSVPSLCATSSPPSSLARMALVCSPNP